MVRAIRSRWGRATPHHTVPHVIGIVGSAAVVGTVVLAAVSLPTSSAGTTGNRLANPSFETTLTPWAGTGLQRVRLSGAPSGYYVARIAPVSGRMVIDDWPGEVRSTTGDSYSAYMSFAAASSSSVGKTVTLTLREHTTAGAWVASWQASTTLATSFKRIQVQGRAVRSGDVVDLYAYQPSVATGNAFYADAAMLSVTPATTTSTLPPSPTPTPTPSTTPSPTPTSTSPSTSSTPTSTANTTSPPAPTTSSIAELSIDTGQAGYLGNTAPYTYVILQEYMYAHVADIKKANPNTE